MRTDTVIKNNKELNEKFHLRTEEGRQMALLSVLTDISETLSIMTDLYAAVNRLTINERQDNNDAEP